MAEILALVGYVPVRASMPWDSRKPTRNEQVSGSSPLVGSSFCPYLSRILEKGEAPADHQGLLYITRTSLRCGRD